MLQFSQINNYKPKIYSCPLATIDKLLPFQFHDFSLFLYNALRTFLVDVYGNKTKISLSVQNRQTTLTENGTWYIYYGTQQVIGLKCGIFQLELETSRSNINKRFYSTFFKITDTPVNYLELGNLYDIGYRLYNINYKDLIYFTENQIKKKDTFTFTTEEDNGDGTQTIIYKRIAETYELKLFTDFNTVNLLEQIILCNVLKYNEIDIFELIGMEFSFDADKDLYDCDIEFKINSLEQNLCKTNFSTFTAFIPNQGMGDDDIEIIIDDDNNFKSIN